jgi:hypothetical protein
LDKLENVPASDPWGRVPIHFANVDAGTGHVLVHFLHAGTYQTLDDETEDVSSTSIDTNSHEFEKATLALEAATTHGLPGLQRLARHEMERLGSDMSLCDIVPIIREDLFGKPPHDPTWIRDYISGKVWSAFEDDPTVFSRPGFFEDIKSPTLTKFLAESVVDLYSEQVKKLREEQVEAAKRGNQIDSLSGSCERPSSNEQDVKASNPAAWPTSTAKLGAFDDSGAAWDRHAIDTSPSLAHVTDSSEPAVSHNQESNAAELMQEDKTDVNTNTAGKVQPEPPHLEPNSIDEQQPSTESLGDLQKMAIHSIKISKKKKKKKIDAAYISPPPPPEPSSLAYELLPTIPGNTAEVEQPPELVPEKMAAMTIAADVPPTQDDATRLMPELTPEPVPVSPVIDPVAGPTKIHKKKLEKKLKREAAEREREAELVNDVGHSEELVPELQPDPETLPLDPFAESSKSQKKKLERELKEEAAEREHEVEAADGVGHSEELTPESQPDTETLPPNSSIGLTKSEKKKLQSKMRSEAALKVLEAKLAAFVVRNAGLIPEAPLEPGILSIDHIAGLSKSQKKKLLKRLQAEAAQQELEAKLALPTVHNPETEIIPEATHDVTQQDQSTTAVVELAEMTNLATSSQQQEDSAQQDPSQPVPSPPQPLHSEPTPNSVPPPTDPASARETGDSWSDWGPPSIWPKKKKKKGKKALLVEEEESAISGSDLIEPPISSTDVVEPTAVVSQDADEGDAWGDGWGDGVLSKKKKKKGKGKKVALEEEEVAVPQQEAESAETPPGLHVIEGEESAVPSADPEFCPFRATHLAVENGGITCAPCQAYIWRVVSQLKEGGGGVEAAG